MKSKSVLLISTAQQWEAISSPTRATIMESVTALGDCTVKEIAHYIGKSPELVHHHLPILQNAGFVIELDPVKSGRHVQRVFRAGADRWKFDTESSPEVFLEGFKKMGRAWSRSNEKLLAQRLENLNAQERENLTDHITIRSETSRLQPSAQKKVRKHLEAIKEIFSEQRKVNQGPLHTIFWSAFEIKQNLSRQTQ